jgi:hypothetical protein
LHIGENKEIGSMARDIGDRTTGCEDDIFAVDIQDDDLERAAASDDAKAITWAYCTNGWYGCPM